MKNFSTEKIRNIAVIGHSGEGKTSLCEDILFNAKAIDRIGKTSDGNTAMDYDEQEIARKISISLSVAACEWKGVKFNLIDIPGFYDFEGEQVAGLIAGDSCLIVTSTSGMLSVGCDKAIKHCLKHQKPMMIFINGTDKENADYFGTLEAIRGKYPRKTAPIQVPIMEGNKMIGYINALYEKAYKFQDGGPVEIDIPKEMEEDLNNVRAALAEAAAESDDTLLEKFFDSGELSREEVIYGIKKGIIANTVIPVLGGSAVCNKGVFNLMDEIIDIMPAPNESKVKVGGVEHEVDSNGKLLVRVFKTIVDPFVGRLNLIKVINGTLKSGDTVLNVNQEVQERISSLYILKGKKQESVDSLAAGDIGAIAKLSATVTGDTLSTVVGERFEEIEFPKPVLSMAVYAENSGDEDKIFTGLNKMMDEDKTIHLEKNLETGETLLSGLGETHIDVIAKKLQSKFKVNAILKTPKVAYRETIRRVATSEGKHKKQSGGHGQYGHVKMRFEPYADGDFMFDEEVVGGTVPKSYIPAVEKGIRENLAHGVLKGYPVINMKAVLTDGSYHDVDSSELAFKLAASIAYREGLNAAMPTLLEPIYQYRIVVPDNYTGDVMGDINKKRGRILGMETEEDMQIINAEVPQSEMFKYATDLVSMTQGRGSFSFEFARYEEVPQQMLAKIEENTKK